MIHTIVFHSVRSPRVGFAGRCNPFLAIMVVLAGILLPNVSVLGQELEGDPVAAAQHREEAASVAVVVDGVELFRLRGTPDFPAGTRAHEVAGRIIAIGRDRAIDIATIRVEPSDLGPRLTAGDGTVTIITATEFDARLGGVTQRELAQIYLRAVKAAVTSYRALRTPERLLWSVGWVIGATVLLIVLWTAGRWAFRRFDLVMTRRLEAGAERLRIQSFRILSADQTWRLLRTLVRGTRGAAIAVLLYAYLNSTLSLFPWTRGFALDMLDLITDPLLTMGRAVLEAIPDLLFLLVLVVVTRLVLRLVNLFFLEISRGTVTFEQFDPDWAMPTYRLVRVFIIALAVVVAFPYIPGSETGAFKGVSLFVGILFSLGSSSVIGNIIAGYTMTYRRAFRDGDRIRVGDIVGDVTQTRLLVTNVRTPKNEDVVIPNSLILSTHVVNYSAHSRKQGLILHTKVGIGYEVPWRQVEAMLLQAAGRTAGLLREPAPFVLQTALGDFAVTYELNVYCDAPQQMPRLYSELHRHVLDVFNEYGVQIMTPAYEGDPAEPKLVRRGDWYAAPAEPPSGSS